MINTRGSLRWPKNSSKEMLRSRFRLIEKKTTNQNREHTISFEHILGHLRDPRVLLSISYLEWTNSWNLVEYLWFPWFRNRSLSGSIIGNIRKSLTLANAVEYLIMTHLWWVINLTQSYNAIITLPRSTILKPRLTAWNQNADWRPGYLEVTK